MTSETESSIILRGHNRLIAGSRRANIPEELRNTKTKNRPEASQPRAPRVPYFYGSRTLRIILSKYAILNLFVEVGS